MKTVRDEAVLILGMVKAIVARMPPQVPLSEEEESFLQPPLEMVLYKYGGQLPCEWQLIIACGMIGTPRYFMWRKANADPKLGAREG